MLNCITRWCSRWWGAQASRPWLQRCCLTHTHTHVHIHTRTRTRTRTPTYTTTPNPTHCLLPYSVWLRLRKYSVLDGLGSIYTHRL